MAMGEASQFYFSCDMSRVWNAETASLCHHGNGSILLSSSSSLAVDYGMAIATRFSDLATPLKHCRFLTQLRKFDPTYVQKSSRKLGAKISPFLSFFSLGFLENSSHFYADKSSRSICYNSHLGEITCSLLLHFPSRASTLCSPFSHGFLSTVSFSSLNCKLNRNLCTSSQENILVSERADVDNFYGNDLANESKGGDSDKVYDIVLKCSNDDQGMENSLELLGIKMSNELVNDVLHKLRFEEKLALRFFTWAGHQDGYKHEFETYNFIMDILSSTKYKAKQFGIVCHMLEYMKRKSKDSVPIDILLSILRKYTEKHLTYLQKFTRKKKIRVRTQPEINALNLLLDSLCKCCMVDEAESIFRKVKNKVKPNLDTYNILFFGWCRVRNPVRGMKILEEMIDVGYTPENFTYTAAIDTFCEAGMVSEAVQLFEFMRTNDSTTSAPTAKAYCVMIVALAKCDRMDECSKLFKEMRESGCLPDVSTYKELIEGLCLADKVDEAYKFLEEMGNKGYPPDVVTYNCFLKVLCDLQKIDEALRLCQRMIEVGCVPSVHTFNMLIESFLVNGHTDRAFEMWYEMDQWHCTRDVNTYCLMIEGLFACNRMEDAKLLLEEVVNKGMKLPFPKFDGFLAQLSEIGDLHSIHKLSEHMRRFYNPAMARRFSISQKRKSMSLRRR